MGQLGKGLPDDVVQRAVQRSGLCSNHKRLRTTVSDLCGIRFLNRAGGGEQGSRQSGQKAARHFMEPERLTLAR
ncbi:hypothetical protein AAJCM20276_06530 [Acetobacter aceti]|uniref:Uncharacterized protein n=1 Tax=Acetobacter aceti TaxID=435 RepID=A0A6S6PFG5_ACEAC|nr:hypothetical protein AAJCM20276_06530 [Acetobacter aceti]